MSGAVYVPVWELRRVLGDDGADQLLKARGGTRLYVPSLPRSNHLVVQTLGIEGALRLARYFSIGNRHGKANTSGALIELPVYTYGTEAKRQRVMLEISGDPSRSISDIALKMGVNERTVRRWRAKHRAIQAAQYQDAAE